MERNGGKARQVEEYSKSIERNNGWQGDEQNRNDENMEKRKKKREGQK
jgi:hypothetical protein